MGIKREQHEVARPEPLFRRPLFDLSNWMERRQVEHRAASGRSREHVASFGTIRRTADRAASTALAEAGFIEAWMDACGSGPTPTPPPTGRRAPPHRA